jgi:hypothetical protein
MIASTSSERKSTTKDPHPTRHLNKLRKRALAAIDVFANDHTLVHGDFMYQSAHVPPADYGIYSISLITPETPIEAIKKAKVVFVECMDKRVALPAYEQLVAEAATQGITQQEILVLSPGGGTLQESPRRERALRNQLTYIAALAPELHTIVVSGHTSDLTKETSGGCGAVKHFCNGEPLVRALHDKTIRKLRRTGKTTDQEQEEAATDMVLSRHAADVLGDLGIAYYTVSVPTLSALENTQTATITSLQPAYRNRASRLRHIARIN